MGNYVNMDNTLRKAQDRNFNFRPVTKDEHNAWCVGSYGYIQL